jgi:hypothetical protein
MLELTDVLVTASNVLAADGGDDDGRGLGLLFLLAGPVFYWIIYMRYRNSDKRHHHESETEASIHDMQVEDAFVQSRKGLSNSSMQGANHEAVRGTIR